MTKWNDKLLCLYLIVVERKPVSEKTNKVPTFKRFSEKYQKDRKRMYKRQIPTAQIMFFQIL